MGAGVKEESASREAFSISESSQAGELASDHRSMGGRGDGSSETLSREKMKNRGESEARAPSELCVGGARGEEALKGEAKASEKGGELLRRPRSSREASGSGRSQKKGRGSHGKERRGERSKEKASLKRRRPEPQERRERERERFSAASAKEAAQRPTEETAPKAIKAKGAARGAASRAEEEKEMLLP